MEFWRDRGGRILILEQDAKRIKGADNYLPTPEEAEVDPETSSPGLLGGGREADDPEPAEVVEAESRGSLGSLTGGGATRGGRSSRSVGSGIFTGLAFPKGFGLGAAGGWADGEDEAGTLSE